MKNGRPQPGAGNDRAHRQLWDLQHVEPRMLHPSIGYATLRCLALSYIGLFALSQGPSVKATEAHSARVTNPSRAATDEIA